MNETKSEYILELNNSDIEVWLYVNPLTGRYARLRYTNEPLAVFSNENIGRAYELTSTILKSMIGHYVPWDEMLEIAKTKHSGLYELISVVE